MANGWFFNRLSVCLLVMALPLLPAGDSRAALSRSSMQASPPARLLHGVRQDELGNYGVETAANGDLRRPQTRRATSGFDQTGSVHHVVGTMSDTKRQRFTPWGGKRTLDNTAIWKRLKFQPWGGKRFARRSVAPSHINSRMSAFTDGSKREFHPWGGKRSI